MLYRKLGTTAHNVSVVAFGTWQLGGRRWAAPGDDDAVALLRRARELGVNLFDVSAVYGYSQDDRAMPRSRAQELVGAAFAGRRDDVVLNLKIGHLDEYTHRVDFTPRRLVEQFEQSLRRLRTDHVEVCLLHAPTMAHIRSGRALAVLETLRAQGRVEAIGYALEEEPEHLLAALEQDVDVVELQYNLLAPGCGPAMDEARRHNVGILASGPFKRGYLTGRYRRTEELPGEDDYWTFYSRRSRDMVQRLLDRAGEHLDAAGSAEGLRREALRFVLGHPAVSAAVVGLRSEAELTEDLAHAEAVTGSGPTAPARPPTVPAASAAVPAAVPEPVAAGAAAVAGPGGNGVVPPAVPASVDGAGSPA